MFWRTRRANFGILTLICLICGLVVLIKKTDNVQFVPTLIEKMVLVKSYECPSAEKPKPKTIPKIIHQVWNNEILPAEFVDSVQSLARDNPFPEWQYYFWTRESGTKFLMDKYPYLIQRFNNETITSNTMRADMIRIAVLHEYGGVYFDLDTLSVRPLASFVDNHECSLAREPTEHAFGQNYLELLITNSAMFCRAKHPFFKHLMFRLSTLTDDCLNPFLCTGPLMISPLYKQLNISNGDAVKLPEVQSSKLFQDKYDTKGARHIMNLNCEDLDNLSPKLSPFFRKACIEWHERGRDNRTISELAYTYHTWFHVYGKELEESPTNSVFNIIPHAKIYGVNL